MPTQTQFPTTLQPDQPMVLDASYRMNRTDRAYIDAQILGIQGVLKNATFSGDAISFRGTSLDTSMIGPADGSFIEKVGGKWAAVAASTVAAAVAPFLTSVALAGDVNGTVSANHVDTLTGPGTGLVTIANGTNFKTAGTSLAFKDSTSVTRTFFDMAHGVATFGNGGASDWKVALGPLVGGETSSGGVWVQPNGTTLTGSNPTFAADTNAIYYNSYNIHNFYSGNNFGVLQMVISNTTLSYQGNSGVVRFSVESAHGKGTFGGGGADFKAVLGPHVTAETAFASLWLLANATSPSSSNQVLASDGSRLNICAPGASGTHSFYFNSGASVAAQMDGANSRFYLGGSTATSPLFADWATPNQSQIFAGTGQTSLRLGTLNAAGVVEIDAGVGVAVGTWSTTRLTVTTAINHASELDLQIANANVLSLVTGAVVCTASSWQWVSAATPTIGQANLASDVAPANIVITPQAPYASATVHVDPGDVVVSIPNSISGASKEGGFRLDFNGSTTMRAGVYAGGSAYGSIWFMDAGSPTTANFAFLGNQSVTYLNAPSGGTVFITTAGSSAYGVGVSGTTTGLLQSGSLVSSWSIVQSYASGTASMFIGQTAPTVDAAAGNLTIQAQGPYASAATNLLAGDVIVNTSASVGAGVKYGGFQVQYSAVIKAALGTYNNAGNGAALWLSVTPSGTNHVLYSSGTNCTLNIPGGGGTMFFYYTGSTALGQWSYEANGGFRSFTTMHFDSVVSGTTLSQLAQTSDAATTTFTIQAQYAFATATGANRAPGNMVLDIGAPTNGGTTEGAIYLSRNSTTLVQMGWTSGTAAKIVSTSTITSSFTVGATNSDFLLTAPVANSVVIDTSKALLFNATGTMKIGTQHANDILRLQADAGTTIIQLSTFTEIFSHVIVNQTTAPSAPAVTKFAIYVDSADGKLKAMSPAGNVTTLAA